METALTQCITVMGVTVLLFLAMLLAGHAPGTHWDQGCGHSPGTPGFTLMTGVPASLESGLVLESGLAEPNGTSRCSPLIAWKVFNRVSLLLTTTGIHGLWLLDLGFSSLQLILKSMILFTAYVENIPS